MRLILCLLAATSLAACNREQADDASDTGDMPVVPAAMTFDGSDYTEQAGMVAHGKRLVQVLHCNSCHGDNLQGGNVSADDPDYGDMNAPNITLLLDKYSDSDFDRLLRHGTPKDGREFWFMPVESYQFLGDRDLAALIAYLRTHKPEGKQLPPIRKGKGFNEEVEKGLFGNAQQQSRRYAAEAPVDVGAQHQRGRDLTRLVCSGCHNSKLQGYEGFTPDLTIAAAFSQQELDTLLTTGKGKSKPDLGLMKLIAVNSLSHLTPGERKAIGDYLVARANQAPSEAAEP